MKEIAFFLEMTLSDRCHSVQPCSLVVNSTRENLGLEKLMSLEQMGELSLVESLLSFI